MPSSKVTSDTVTVTADGRTVVDIGKLFSKPHIQEMIQKMRSKTKVVAARSYRTHTPELNHTATD